MSQVLISNGYRNDNYETALHCAVTNNDLQLVKKLLSQGFNVNSRNNTGGRTPLHEVAYNNVGDSHYEVA